MLDPDLRSRQAMLCLQQNPPAFSAWEHAKTFYRSRCSVNLRIQDQDGKSSFSTVISVHIENVRGSYPPSASSLNTDGAGPGV